MKRIFAFLAITCLSSAVFAQSAPGLADQLNGISEQVQSVIFKAQLDGQLASQKAQMNDRVSCIGMGHRECREMIAEHVAGGEYSQAGNIPPDTFKTAHEKGEAAYKAWIAGKSASQRDAAKKLYVAWLTMLDGMAAYSGDITTFNDSRAGYAWTQARNEFKVDSITD